MPGDSEHPVTVGDLMIWIDKRIAHYRPATLADLVSALRAEGVLRTSNYMEHDAECLRFVDDEKGAKTNV